MIASLNITSITALFVHMQILTNMIPLREKYPNMEFFLVRIFLYIYSVNLHIQYTGKYGPEKTPHLDTFHAVSLNGIYIKPSKTEQDSFYQYYQDYGIFCTLRFLKVHLFSFINNLGQASTLKDAYILMVFKGQSCLIVAL